MPGIGRACAHWLTRTMPTLPTAELAVFPNPARARDYLVHIECPEFTCLCPLTGQPDFATLALDYIPDKLNLELKGLKLYLWSFRDRGVFHEAVTNEIVDHMAARIKPRFLRLTARWYVRGGLFTTVVVEHRKRDWKAAPGTTLGSAMASATGTVAGNPSVRG